MLEILKTKQLSEEIRRKRTEVAELLMKNSPQIKNPQLTCISTEDLRILFNLYDEIFFINWFKNSYKGKIKFSLSKKMTRSAGKTMCPKNIARIRQEELILEIRIGVDFFLNYGQTQKNNTVCGLMSNNSLEALMLVFEHELCHVIEFLLYNKSSCAGKRFKTIANNLFGHTESYHKLPTARQIADEVMGCRIGDNVLFEYKGMKLTGVIYGINKRATVLVSDRNGFLKDKYGNRYTRYYVPLKMLSRLN